MSETMWRCTECGKWSHAKRKPHHHEVFTLSEPDDESKILRCEQDDWATGYVVACGERDDYIQMFVDAWEEYEPNPGKIWLLPDTYRGTIARWFRMGVPIEIIEDAARTATRSSKNFNRVDRFRYMCGIVWRQVHAVSEAVFDRDAIEGSFLTEERISDLRSDAYDIGWKNASRLGMQRFWNSWTNPVTAFVDTHQKTGMYMSTRGVSAAEFNAYDLEAWPNA